MFFPEQPTCGYCHIPRLFRSGLVCFFLVLLSLPAFAQRPTGVDVSHWQGSSINWVSVKNSGVTFAWCKATEGAATIDDTFSVNIVNAKNAGVLIGAYHYARPDLHIGNSGADQEAANFWSVVSNYVKGSGTYMMPALDIEQDLSTADPAYTKTTLSQWVNRWCQTVTGLAASNGVTIKPIVYTYVSYASTWLNSTVTNYPLWMANYNGQSAQTGGPSSTSPWSAWNFWQYSSSATVSGISGGCDGDVFNGTAAGMASYVVGGYGPPSLLSQPSNRYADQRGSITMRVSAAGAAPLKYQWRFNGANISLATNSTLTLTNIQTTNAGSYTVVVTNSSGSITSSIATLTVNGLFTPVFADTFDTNSSTNWTLFKSSADTRAIFAFDYSGLGIPAAPNSVGTTKGLRLEANLANTNTAALSASPNGQSFGGNYRLHFDMWINVNGPFPDGGSGSTELVTGGIGTAGNRVQWGGAGTTADGVWFAVDGEGGTADTSTTQGDFLAYIGTSQQASGSGVYAAGVDSTSRMNGDSYYANVFPGGQSAPLLQRNNYAQQTGSLDVGTVGLAWRDVVINKNGSTVEWFIDGLKIATASGASISASNVFVGYWDPYTSVSDNTNLSFGLIGNVRVEVPVVAPSISAPPLSITVNQNSNATFTVTATGTPTPAYQWQFNGTNIVNATNSVYTRTNVQAADAGSYSVVLTNVGGSLTSGNAVLAVNLKPTFISQPMNTSANVGSTATFSVGATGTGPLSYQWRLNGGNLVGQTTNTLILSGVQMSQAGSYSVVVTNVAGVTNSANAFLSVVQMQFATNSLSKNGNALQFAISGAPGTGYFVEGSTNLATWFPIGTFTNTNGILQIIDTNATNENRYYRVSAP